MTIRNNVDEPSEYENLSIVEKEILLKWIITKLNRGDKYYKKESSYSLKHYFEDSLEGFYISNGQFKGAMLAAEYTVANPNDKNWYFKISAIHVDYLRKGKKFKQY